MTKVPSEAHGDGASGYFGNPSGENDGGRCVSTGESGGEGKWNGQTIGDTDYDVANNFASREMFLLVVVKQMFLTLLHFSSQ